MNHVEIGQVIRAKREELGITQKTLADWVKISRPYLAQIEAGTRKPADTTLIKTMSVLGLSYKDLITVEPSQNEKAVLDLTFTLFEKLGEYLTEVQLAEIVSLLINAQEAAEASQAIMQSDPIQAGPDGWVMLSNEDRRLMQRIVNRLLKKEGEEIWQEDL